ncbi:MAG: hypothetical protein HC907_24885 [Richelia sp. SM1_7_0]|nr:hypothetical protein [Richelia sp. SM1_7_0]
MKIGYKLCVTRVLWCELKFCSQSTNPINAMVKDRFFGASHTPKTKTQSHILPKSLLLDIALPIIFTLYRAIAVLWN